MGILSFVEIVESPVRASFEFPTAPPPEKLAADNSADPPPGRWSFGPSILLTPCHRYQSAVPTPPIRRQKRGRLTPHGPNPLEWLK